MSTSLPYETAYSLFTEMRSLVAQQPADEDLQEMFRSFLHACFDYAKIRADWALMSREERNSRDNERTAYHNLVIDRLTLVKRLMNADGLSCEWAGKLSPDDSFATDRKTVGDFACFITAILGVESR